MLFIHDLALYCCRLEEIQKYLSVISSYDIIRGRCLSAAGGDDKQSVDNEGGRGPRELVRVKLLSRSPAKYVRVKTPLEETTFLCSRATTVVAFSVLCVLPRKDEGKSEHFTPSLLILLFKQ